MIEDIRDKKRRVQTARIVLVSLVALLVIGVGVGLTPRTQAPREPSFSESALASAYGDAIALHTAVDGLRQKSVEPGASPSAAGAAEALTQSAELLQLQARALRAPEVPRDSASASPPNTATVETLVERLASSAAQRLSDAANADGGPARLLAAVGIAQFLESTRLAAALGLPAPEVPAASMPSPATVPEADGQGTLPTSPADAGAEAGSEPEQCRLGPAPDAAGAGQQAANEKSASAGQPAATATQPSVTDALAAAARAELEAVYVYQVALTRLDAGAASVASVRLGQHQDALQELEELSREHCANVPQREAGYRLPAGFDSAPAAALGKVETGVIAAYGDLVALSSGATRSKAIAGMLATAQHAASWGSHPGALPGLAVEPSQLPPLPTSPIPSGSPAG